MRKQILRFRLLAVICLILALCSSDAFAWGGGGRGGGGRGSGGHEMHYYREGRWYRSSWFWFDTAVTALTVGALVASLPPRHTTVIYGGMPYYYDGVYYYRPYSPSGYVVVQPPVMVQQPVVMLPEPAQAVAAAPVPAVQPQSALQDIFTVNVPNSRGGYTPVTLKRSGNGFVGPQGEYYNEFPRIEQLKLMYGK